MDRPGPVFTTKTPRHHFVRTVLFAVLLTAGCKASPIPSPLDEPPLRTSPLPPDPDGFMLECEKQVLQGRSMIQVALALDKMVAPRVDVAKLEEAYCQLVKEIEAEIIKTHG